MYRTITRHCGRLVLALLLLVAAGCDEGELLTPEPPPAGEMFTRYVSIGNSITAGFQSAGINMQLQQQAYPVLLAQQMGTEFFIPQMAMPGCPPPLTQIFPEQERLGPPDVECALRDTPIPPHLNNVAVPGAEVIDVLANREEASNPNPLTTFVLGGRTQISAALDVDPTFVSIWIGNNDVLGAALAGNPDRITSQESFEQRYRLLLDVLAQQAELQEGGLLISVADVTQIPALSPGVAYMQALQLGQQAQALPPNVEVANSCAPSGQGGVGDQMLVPFQHGAALLQVAIAVFEDAGQNAPTITLDCAEDRTVQETVGAAFGGVQNIPPEISASIADVAGISLLTQQEIGTLAQAVASFNAYIEEQAEQRGYAFLDVNPLFNERGDQIPSFPELFDIPGNEFTPDEPFGPLFSLDGVHPSSAAHAVVADAAIEAINAQYGTSIPVVD